MFTIQSKITLKLHKSALCITCDNSVKSNDKDLVFNQYK